MTYEILLQRLQKARKENRLSLRDMGKAIGKSGQQVCFLEKGKTPLKVQDYLLICEILKISPWELMKEETFRKERRTVSDRIQNLSERDFRIIKDLIMLMELKEEDL
ncbi:MAG: helix-turn-helix transcriptional regulator [Clostridia bacterium]|nr:helix-turn-helix transcriptional regulator [Clostridia bacterium]